MKYLPSRAGLVFRRENHSFFSNRMVLLIFLIQVTVMATLQGTVFAKLAPVLQLQPQVIQPIINRLFSVQFVAISLLSVMHVVQLTTLREKASGLLESLLTTPLTVHDLVIGKTLHTSLMGLFSGLLVSISIFTVICFSIGDLGLLSRVPWRYLLFAIVVAPMFVTGMLGLVTLLIYRAKEPALVMLPFTLGVMLLIGVGNIPSSPWINSVLHCVLVFLAIGAHLLTWILAQRTLKEKLVCG